MMQDGVRMDAYYRAIKDNCIDAVVCEIGVGLAPLSLMALKAGAARVYGIECDSIILQSAKQIMLENGYDESRFIPVLGYSNHVSLPERVDVILSETLDSIGIGENATFYMADACMRFLKPGGIVLPKALECYLALSSPEAFRKKEDFWLKEMPERFGLEYRTVAALDRTVKHTLPIAPEEIIGSWQCWQRINFLDPGTFRRVVPIYFKLTEDVEIQGLACAFKATLVDGVEIKTFPDDPPTHWKQGFIPFPEKPVFGKAGHIVYIELDVALVDVPSINTGMSVISGPAEEVELTVRENKKIGAKHPAFVLSK